MSKQLELFNSEQDAWAEKVWKTAGPQIRQEVIAVLSQMGNAMLKEVKSGKAKPAKEEKNNES
jgi:hypothetical protein